MSASPHIGPDPNKEGSSWCAACGQSITTARVASHIASAKHASAVLKAGGSVVLAGAITATADAPPAESKVAKRPATKKKAAPPAEPSIVAAEVAEAIATAAKPRKKAAPKAQEPLDSSPSPSSVSGSAAPKTMSAVAPPKKKSTAGAAASATETDHGLPRDPSDPSRFRCGICGVSLDAARAARHRDTKSHRRAEEEYLAAGVRGLAVE